MVIFIAILIFMFIIFATNILFIIYAIPIITKFSQQHFNFQSQLKTKFSPISSTGWEENRNTTSSYLQNPHSI